MSKHVKLLLENVQKPSCTPLGNPAEAETRRGNFDIGYGCRRSGRNPLHLWRGGGQHHVEGTGTMVCTLILKNGFTVTDTSACVDVRNFQEEKGKEISFSKARDKVFHFLAFAYCDEHYGNK